MAACRLFDAVLAGALSVLASGADARASAVASLQGFRPVKAGSEVFVLLRGHPGEPSVQKTATGVQLVLPHTRMKRPFRSLETRYFATPVKLVSALRRQSDLVIDVALKDDAVRAQLAPRLDVRRKGGVVMVALAFPPGEPDKTPPPLPKGKAAKSADKDRGEGEPEANPATPKTTAGAVSSTAGAPGAPDEPEAHASAPKDTPMEACQRKCGIFLSRDPPDEVAHEACNRKCEAAHPIRGAKTVFPAKR